MNCEADKQCLANVTQASVYLDAYLDLDSKPLGKKLTAVRWGL
jgi:hypothetical protein